jgi:ATP-dependent Clp protease ATP-binding subunit ClpX
MYDLPQRDDIIEVVIDQAVVEGRRKPQLRKPGRGAASSKDAA